MRSVATALLLFSAFQGSSSLPANAAVVPVNVAFGGPELDRLYVTGALADEKTSKGALFRLNLPGVRGLRLLQ